MKMNKTITSILLSLIILIATAIFASAQTSTLMWDKNPEPDVIGYKIYYKSDSPSLPFNGTEIPEGASPIFVDGVNTTALDVFIPDDGSVYYFMATAINDSGVESSFSDIIASGWIPDLMTPVENESVGANAIFTWDLPPSNYNVTFDLYYGTDPELNVNAAGVTAAPPNFKWPQAAAFALAAIALVLTAAAASGMRRNWNGWRPIRIAACFGIIALQAACGGGGGGSSTPSGSLPAANPTNPPVAAYTNIVTDIAETQYLASDLESSVQYYWKVVAVDNWGNTYESFTKKFTTDNF